MSESNHHSSQSPNRQRQSSSPLEKLLRRIDRIHLGPWGRIIGIVGMFGGTLALSILVGVMLRSLIISDALNPFSASAAGELPTATPNATPNPDFLAPTLDIGNAPTWQGTDRVTVLLMGADTRPGDSGRYRPRSDSIMLLMLDPELDVASVLSVPRDLWVEIPGYGINRINTAYFYGGGDLAMQTVQYNLGVRVNYYVMVEFDAFTTFVDEIGGIDVYVPRTIYDPEYPDMFYGTEEFYIQVGQHHLDGATALKYARTRHGDSDFNRAQRQQDILFAIRDQVLTTYGFTQLIQNAPGLYATVSDSITTNMTLEEMVSLAGSAKEIDRENIRTGVIDANYASDYVTNQGAQVLIPNRARIGELLSQVFWLTP
jgi:LCP family protein required for cell wall assembly